MNELEDEPMDVQQRKPVAEEVTKGELDQLCGRKTEDDAKLKFVRHECHREIPIPKINCCDLKRKRYEESLKPQCIKVEVFAPPCKQKKYEIIPRDCMTKEEYLDFLAKAKERCDKNCDKEVVIRRLRAVSPRIDELAQPTKRRVMNTLEERSSVLPPEFIEKLLRILECETALTPEQAETFVRDMTCVKRHGKKRKGKKRDKCGEREVKIIGAGDPNVDDEAANCMYLMAVRFVRSILNWKCCSPRRDYADIAQVLLDRLSETMEYKVVGKEDRKSQQMRLLVDIVACWITGVLIEVSDRHKGAIAAQCLRRQAEAEEQEMRDALEEEMDEDEDELDNGSEDEEEERERLTAATSLATQADLEDLTAASTQYEEEDFETEFDSSLLDASLPEPSLIVDKTADSISSPEIYADFLGFEGVDESAQTEAQPLADAATDAESLEVTTVASVVPTVSVTTQPETILSEVEVVASRMMDAFKTDVPFVTFAKILETIFCMIECESENHLEQAMDNRIHRAIYEKFEAIIKMEDESLLDERLKDVVDVTTGKIARWLRKTLNDRQIKFLEDNPAAVESKELRDWTKKVIEVAEVAENWSSWLIKETCEAVEMKSKLGAKQMTRGDWQDWTGKFETDALLWRRAYLEAQHHQHHDRMMMTQRKVLKTGTYKKPEYSEIDMKTTNYDSTSRMGC